MGWDRHSSSALCVLMMANPWGRLAGSGNVRGHLWLVGSRSEFQDHLWPEKLALWVLFVLSLGLLTGARVRARVSVCVSVCPSVPRDASPQAFGCIWSLLEMGFGP